MNSIRKIVIFGSTGNTGQCAVEAALELGLSVTVMVRDESRLGPGAVGRVLVVLGDVLDSRVVDVAVQGQDAVVVVLGTRNDLSATTMMSDGLRNILTAMETYNVNKISACMSVFLLMDAVPPRYEELNADHARMRDLLQASSVDWVAVLPPHITDEPGTGDYTLSYGEVSRGRKISKYDLGRFLVTCLEDPNNTRQLCVIGNEN